MVDQRTIGVSPCDTLAACVDEYLINRGIDKKKYFVKYLVIGKRVWQDIFLNTLFVTKSVMLPLKSGDPFHYIEVPIDCKRIFSVGEEDECGEFVPLWYNSKMNVLKKPVEKKCSCESCNCGGTCTEVNSMQTITKLVFTINGVNYYEKIWLKYCPNGDIIEYREVPVKKYLDRIGDGGDYNEDYNEDYSIGSPPFANFEIVIEKFQRTICKLKAKPCGCPEETTENLTLIEDYCSCYLPFFSRCRKKHCERFLANPNPTGRGQVKLSECGNLIYYRPPSFRGFKKDHKKPTLPKYLILNYQTSGLAQDIDDQVMVPDYALMAMWTGIDWRSKLFKGSYSLAEKKEAKYEHNDAINKVILFLNPISLQELASIQDAPMQW